MTVSVIVGTAESMVMVLIGSIEIVMEYVVVVPDCCKA